MNQKHHSIQFFTFSLRKNIFSILFVLFTICLVLFSRENLSAAKSGLMLWANNVVPALFPFFIATELLTYTNLIPFLGKLLKRWMRPIFNVPGEGSFALLMGIISGYPIGAKIVTKFREDGTCTKEECERLLAFTNNSGPLFIIGTVGISLFADTTLGILLLFTHILACLTTGFLFRFWKKNDFTYLKMEKSTISKTLPQKSVSLSNLGEVISNSITSSISTILMIGGFIVLFSVILSVLTQSHVIHLLGSFISPIFNFFHIDPSFADPFINGIFELTNGVKQVASIPCKFLSVNIVLTSFLLGFGGFSVLLQVFSIISKTDLSIFPYFIGKLLQGLFAAFYTYLLYTNIPFINLDLAQSSSIFFSPTILFYLFIGVVIITLFIRKVVSQTHRPRKLNLVASEKSNDSSYEIKKKKSK